jgi:murein DD-endopeptidase MepM/ murein hydrolase activator NlpD
MRAEGLFATVAAAVVLAAPARAADVAPEVQVAPARAADVTSEASREVSAAAAERASRDVSPLAAREALLGEQAAAARAQARWRLRALYRLAVADGGAAPLTRARALDAGTRALARDLGEARALAAEQELARDEHAAREAAARAEQAPGAAPAFVAPVGGAVVSRFGLAPSRPTGLLVRHAGVRLAARVGADVRAPAAGTVARVAREGLGWTAMIDHGVGWISIVGGLAEAAVESGARVTAGQRLGAAREGGVAFEVWRGRRPVDPMMLVAPGR